MELFYIGFGIGIRLRQLKALSLCSQIISQNEIEHMEEHVRT